MPCSWSSSSTSTLNTFFLIFQVWAGNEDCEPVTWRECQLVPKQVDFKVPKIECFDAEQIPYMDCVDIEKQQVRFVTLYLAGRV